MDLSKFELLGEDETHYSVGHPKGKTLRVEKSKLNEKAHALISKLKGNKNAYAEGGEVISDNEFVPDALSQAIPDYLNPNPPAAIPEYLAPNPPKIGRDAAAKYFINDQSSQLQTPQNAEAIRANQPIVGKGPSIAFDADKSQVPNQPIQPQEDGKAVAVEIPKTTQEISNQSSPTQKEPILNSNAYQEMKKHVLEEGEALKRKGEEEVSAYKDIEKGIEKLPTPEDIYSNYQKRDQALMQAFESKKIDPDRYIKNMDTGAKISQGIALILGGIGAGLTGGENVALKMLNQKINADIEAQKEDKSSAMNLWKMNKEALGDNLSANLATQNQLYTGLKFKLGQAASKSNSDVAMARAGQAAAQIDQAIAQNNMKLSLLNSPDNGSETDFVKKTNGLKMFAPDIAKEKEEKYIPGVGVASVKPTDKDRETLASVDNIKKGLVELQALATQGPTIKGSTASQVNKTKIAALQLQMKTAYQLGVLSQSDLDMLDKLVADPGSILTGQAMAQLKATEKSMDAIKNSVSNKLGITPFKQQAEMKTMGGIPYIKVPGGWQKAQ